MTGSSSRSGDGDSMVNTWYSAACSKATAASETVQEAVAASTTANLEN